MGGQEMRSFRVSVVGVLVAGGLAVLVPAASASVPSVSKACQSLNKLNKSLNKAVASGNVGEVDSGAINNLSESFRKAAKTAPKALKSVMNTIADVAADVADTGSPAAAAAALKKAGAKFTSALVTWGTYLTKNCSGSSSSASSSSSGSRTASATVPRDCSALETGAVSELLGGVPVLDSDSNFNTTLKELHCIWYTNDAVSEQVSVQLGLADDFIGFYASQEGTGTRKYTKVSGFDEARLYGDDLLIAKRNGLAVAVDAGLVYPQSTQEEIVAVALEATTT
jgi:hypothetical protein